MTDMRNTITSSLASDTDLLLVFAPFHRLIVSMENIGIEYIAAYARAKGFSVGIINAGLHGLSTGDVADIVARSRFKVLGLSTIHWNLAAALKIAKASRDAHPECHIILGGVEAALNAEAILLENPFVDSIGMGEGELTVSALLAAIGEGRGWKEIPGLAYREDRRVRFTPPLPLIRDLDSLPHPARDDMAAVLDACGPVCISSSRGCFGRCSFCSVRAFYGLSPGPSWRGRSPASVVREIWEINGKYGATLFSFIDETVMGPGDSGRERLLELARQIKKSGMKISFFMTIRADQVEIRLFRALKEAGLRKVEIGIESMAPSQLRRYGKAADVAQNRKALKILERLGIAVEIFMIPFDSRLSAPELRKNLRFYRSRFDGTCRYDVAPLSLGNYIYPYPGTDARRVYEERGWLTDGDSHVSFRAVDERIQRVGQTVIAFTALFESAFPMSFSGFGNLWINGIPLPDSVYGRICEVCGEFGDLAVRFADWALSVLSRPLRRSPADIGMILTDLRDFLRQLAGMRLEMVELTKRHHRDAPEGPRFRIENGFAEELHLLGEQKKRLAREAINDDPLDENAALSHLLNLMIKEPWL